MPADWTDDPPPVVKTISFEQGHESAADSPWGFQRLRVSTDGRLEYEHRSRGTHRSASGTIDPDRVVALQQALGRTSFPEKPQETFLPGTSVIRLTMTPPTYSVLIDYFEGMNMDGYRDVIRELSELNNGLREGHSSTLAAWRYVPATGG